MLVLTTRGLDSKLTTVYVITVVMVCRKSVDENFNGSVFVFFHRLFDPTFFCREWTRFAGGHTIVEGVVGLLSWAERVEVLTYNLSNDRIRLTPQ